MKFPRCGSESCQEESQHYLIDKKIYVCYTHKTTKYSADGSILLIPPDPIKTLLKVIDQCRKELLVSSQSHGYLGSESEHNGFDSSIREAVGNIFLSLDDAVTTRQFYKLEALLQEAKRLEDLVMNDKLFIKHSVATNWKKALSTVEGTIEKSPDLVTKELREEYNKLLERTVNKLKQQRERIQEEKSELGIKLSSKEKKIEELRDQLKKLEKSQKQEPEEQKEEYKQKIQDLIATQTEIEEAKSINIEEIKEKDQLISELREEIKTKSDELIKSLENIEQLEQKVKTNAEKAANLRARIKDLKSNYNAEKEELQKSYSGQVQEVRDDCDAKLKETCEKIEKEQQEKQTTFDSELNEKNGEIDELQKKILELTKDHDKEKANHQTLKQSHADFEEEKQSILQKHAEEKNKLEDELNNFKKKISNAEDINEKTIDEPQQLSSEDTSILDQNTSFPEETKDVQSTKITNLDKELTKTLKKLDLALQDNKILEQRLIPFTTYTQKDFASFCRSIDPNSSKDILKSSDFTLYREGSTSMRLRLDNTMNLDLISKADKRFPNFENFSIDFVQNEHSEDINNFLKNSFPNMVDTFSFFNDFENKDASIGFYMQGLLAIGPRVQKKLKINQFSISEQNFVNLLSKFNHVECFSLSKFKIDLSSIPDLEEALCETRIKKIELSEGSGYHNEPLDFDNLIKGLSQSEDFKKSFEEIFVDSCKLTGEEVCSVLEKYGFKEIKSTISDKNCCIF
ncbi:unnamed protein product [Moneuplotes crassus]|uniref:Uncharacterized protein n=1 Tax=Euplotes crassus TaxID=5936 RepID=A0AAD1Y7G3_EUPCR|nr:unnamed protein product [Moneuplotes crassus]